MYNRVGRTGMVMTLAGAVGLTLSVVGMPVAQAGASPRPITLALVTSETGPAAPEYQDSEAGFLARVALQNAEGGVHGHRIHTIVVDDQTSPTAVVTGVQDAISKGVSGIVVDSPLFYFAAKYPEHAGLPVTGSYQDGPEWGERPYTNMFASDVGSVDPEYPVNTEIGNILKHFGASVIGTYGYSISPSSSRAAVQSARSFRHAGGKIGVIDTSVPFGSVDFTATALTAKQHHVNAIVPGMDNDSNFAMATSFDQAGVKLKVPLYTTGYEPGVIGSPVWADLRGAYFISLFRPFSLPNAGTRQMQDALVKYQHFAKSQFPTFEQYESWVGADLMIKGLQTARPDASHAAVIKALRGIESYNADGLLPKSIDYSTVFGHDPPEQCSWVLQAHKGGFVLTQSQPFCGTDIRGSSTASSG